MAADLIIVRRSPLGAAHRALLLVGNQTFACVIGRGLTTVFKREGDGATPAHVAMRPQQVWYRPDRVARPKSSLPVLPIGADDGWCDAPGHPAYNNPVRLPFPASHERMMRDDNLYDLCVVLDFNRAPRPRKRLGGSAIFLHCAKPGFPPTAGCVAMDRAALNRLLPRLDRHTRLIVDR